MASGTARLLLALAALCGLGAFQTAAHEHGGLACGHHHPDVVLEGARLLGARLALIELREGPDAARAAAEAAAAAGPWGAGRGAVTGAGARPLRIRPVYQLGMVPARPAARIRDEIIPTSAAALAKYISVKPTAAGGEAPRPFNGRQSCLAAEDDGPATNPDTGNYDLLLYVTGDASRCFPGMVAMSAACEIDPASGRPTVGSLNICAEALSSTSTGQVIDTIVHEILHVLGFSPTHYPDWRGPDGKRYERPVTRVGPRRAPFLSTPRVLAEARRHFNCSALPGAPLETEGMGMSSLAHWEYRNTQHELMTAARPLDRGRAVMSRLTLAALEDSGWYDPNYAAAADLEWGRGAGCEFVLASCAEFARANPGQDLFCPAGQADAVRCSAGNRLWGKCRGSSFTDGCLIVGRDAPSAAGPGGKDAGFSGNFDCLPPYALDTTTRALLPRLGAAGTAGADRCFALVAPAGATKTAPTLCTAPAAVGGKPACTSERALCFKAACDAGGRLSVEIAGAGGGKATRLACPSGTTLKLGAKLTGRFASGALQCPDNARTCRGLVCGACDPEGGFCSFGDGKCHCWLERTGPGCTASLAPTGGTAAADR
ncbi:MAG: hypothetical protein J3K34DRAFT_475892 [Monoraphidium minutum]|nr:MAG: hypothetical protein J3K34DRAFT_475892 [Monoraphidium minutum]